MNVNEQLITRFYQAFQRRDAATMVSCYHQDVQFSDPAFPDLKGAQAGAMWTMLCERGKDLKIEFSGVQADEKKGRAHWEAWYTFTVTGNKVHNIIDAEFEFRDGLIVRHRDRFDFKRWAGQALGTMGKLLGGLLQGKVQKTAAKGLAEFMQKKA